MISEGPKPSTTEEIHWLQVRTAESAKAANAAKSSEAAPI